MEFLRSFQLVWRWLVICAAAATTFVAAQQSFRNHPEDVSVIRGQTAMIQCSIDELKGTVQWTKGRFGLGFDRDIPGYDRYRIVGSEEQFEYDLMITNVQLQDDDEFQCQVGPAGGDPPLIGNALVTVLIPPDTPIIDGHENNDVVKVPNDLENVILTCIATNGKPAATLTWYRNDVEITEGVVYTVESQPDSKLQNSRNILTFTPSNDDDSVIYRCSATNDAIMQPLSTSITLNVLHPPGPPAITGYTNGQVVQTGDTVELKCTSQGGNPLGQVYWYRNDVQLDFSFTIAGDIVENILVFTVQPSDMNAIYRCDVSNLVTATPLKAEVNMTVLFAPETVEITGHEQAKAGEEKTLTCTSGISNPAATITWFSRGRQLNGGRNKIQPSPQGGFITSSKIKVTLTNEDDNVMYQCHATNEALANNNPAIDTVTLQVMYPPEVPVITGYTSGREVTAGEIHTMLCTSVGGNPLATISWWKGDQTIQGPTTIAGEIVRNQVSFILKPDDNMASYTCKASNEATPTPLEAEVTLHVNFPPTSLEISTDPEQITAGEHVTITCKSSTSNPASTVTWWKDGEVLEGRDGGVVDAEFGGKSSLSHLDLTPEADEHGDIYACQASNVLIERAVSDAVTLDVRSKPRLPEDAPVNYTMIEHTAALFNFTARGNPEEIEYTWTKDGTEAEFSDGITVLENGGVLNVSKVTRAHSGEYRLVAKNDEGEAEITWTLDVHYPAAITSEIDTQTIEKGQNATFACTVDAHPMPDSTITWVRSEYSMSRAVIETVGPTSTLTISRATKDDSGEFLCTANNGIGEAATHPAILIVKFAPVIDVSNVKAAADVGSDARLPCVASGAPEITFIWLKDGVAIDLTSERYSVEEQHDGVVQYTSHLVIQSSTKDDHGFYTCKATNELGEDSAQIRLDGTSKPDAPTEVRFINATHNSMTLSWIPGFNGGADQSFQVRYQEQEGDDSGGYKYEDVVPNDATVFTVTGLKLATEYSMQVRGKNEHGDSPFSGDVIKARTSAIAPRPDGTKKPDDTPLFFILTMTIIGLVLLGLNVLLILYFIHKRSRNKGAQETPIPGNTSEFNAPTITEDSKSYTSFGGRSLDDYPDEFYVKPYEVIFKLKEDDELHKFLPIVDYGADGPYRPNKGPTPYHPGPDYRSLPRGVPPSEAGSRGGHYSNGKLPHPVPHDNDYNSDSLRKPQSALTHMPSGPSSHIYSLPRGGGTKQAPPPPVRLSSNGDVKPMPPLPSRNYDVTDISRYGSGPGSNYGSAPRGSSRSNGVVPKQSAVPRTPPEMRGHLV